MILKDEKYRKNIKFRRFAKKGGEYYSVPSITKAVILISWGDTAEEAMAKIKPLADVIDAYDLHMRLINYLFQSPRWKVVYFDDTAIIFLKDTVRNAALINKFRIDI